MGSPNPWLITDLTPEVIKARDGSIRTIAAQRDGSRPGDDDDSDPVGVIFSENFDSQPDFTSSMYSLEPLQEANEGYTLPNNWDIVYQNALWSPTRGFPGNHDSFEILAADSADARGGTGKAMKNYRESANVDTITEADGSTVLNSGYTHIRIWQATSPNFNTTKTSIATVNGVEYLFSTTTGANGASYPTNALALDDQSLGAVDTQFNNITGQRPFYGVFSNAIAVPTGATVTITNGDIQGYDGKIWDERVKKYNSDGQLTKTPIDPQNPEGTEELYVEFWIKFSENWYQRGYYEDGWLSKIFRASHVTPGGNAVSGFQGDMGPLVIWDYKSDNFGVRHQVAFRGGPPRNVTTEDNYKGTPVTDEYGGSQPFTSTSISGMEVGGNDPQLPDLVNGGLLADTTDVVYHESVYGPPEKWTKVAIYLKMNSAPGVRDGVYSQYIDGHRIQHFEDVPFVAANTENLMVKWNHFSIGGNDYFHPFPGSERFEDWYMIDDVVVRDSLPEVL